MKKMMTIFKKEEEEKKNKLGNQKLEPKNRKRKGSR